MIYTEKRLQKFLVKLQALSAQLHLEKSVGLHQAINQFYYLQKAEEVKFLIDKLQKLEAEQARLARMIETSYCQIYDHWRKDVRELSNHHRNKTRIQSVH